MFGKGKQRRVSGMYRQVVLFAVVGLLVGAVAVFVQPFRYGATVRMLIIQRSTLGLDPYTAVKSAERIADNLSQVIYTQDFFAKTLKQDTTINQANFPDDPSKRMKEWQKTVRTALTPGTGLLTVTALSTDKQEASKISSAIAGVLTVAAPEYIGGDLEVKLVDAPLVSTYPISPNIPLGLGLGLAIGALIGLGVTFGRRSTSSHHGLPTFSPEKGIVE